MNRPQRSTRTGGTDGELLGRFAAGGDQAAFAELVARHGPMVLRLCRRVCDGDGHAAEDLAQQVFLSLAARASALKTRASLAGWLYRASWNVSTRHRRDRIARGRHEEAAAGCRAAAGGDEVPFAVVTSELREALARALATLPEGQRDALVLHHFAGHTVEQTASVLGVPAGTAAAWLSRGRGGLREQLERQGVVLGAEAVAAWLALEAACGSPCDGDAVVVECVSQALQPRLAVLAAPLATGGAGGAAAGLATTFGLSRAAVLAVALGILGAGGVATGDALKPGLFKDILNAGGGAVGTASKAIRDLDPSPSPGGGGGGISIGQLPEPGGAALLSAVSVALLRRPRRH